MTPIDEVLPEILRQLGEAGNLVLQAPPGAGKTTAVPPALLEHVEGLVLVTQPRRIAARLAGTWVARQRGEKAGESVGYQVRFENRTGKQTRLIYLTEGTLLRRWQADPELRGVSTVVFDELHERHLETDLALALLRRLQTSARTDLQLVAMSATLDADPVAKWLDAPVVTSSTRTFDVAVEHAPHVEDGHLEVRVGRAVRRALREEPDGDVLVFLPGVAEIERSLKACGDLRGLGAVALPLHGGLSADEQERAVEPNERRKVILSTNVAETSVTIDGVVVVIDSGLVRRPEHDPWSGLSALATRQISQASATQRAGRAGRTRPGRCIRLYTQHELQGAPVSDPPEIVRADLAGLVLTVASSGIAARELQWLEDPPEPALDAADQLLQKLGALSGEAITELGRKMARLPVHPRLARLVCEAARRGVRRLGCDVAALLGERWPRRRQAQLAARSDLLVLLDRLSDVPGLRRRVSQASKQLRGLVDGADAEDEDELLASVLAAYPDRVARRTGKGARLQLVDGSQAELSEGSSVQHEELLVAVAARNRKRGLPVVDLASAVEPEWLLDQLGEQLTERVDVTWVSGAERVDVVSRLLFGKLVLSEDALRADSHPEAVAELLREKALAAGVERFDKEGRLERLSLRSRYIHDNFDQVALEPIERNHVERVLSELCDGRRSFAELEEASLVESVLGLLPAEARKELEEKAPEYVTLPSGRRLRVHYESDRPPWVESYLQDFFGMEQGPTIGERALTLHLLAPNRRAVQVTDDLSGFWDRHYPSIRSQLRRRYSKHDWPENPRTASPPSPSRRKRRR